MGTLHDWEPMREFERDMLATYTRASFDPEPGEKRKHRRDVATPSLVAQRVLAMLRAHGDTDQITVGVEFVHSRMEITFVDSATGTTIRTVEHLQRLLNPRLVR